MESLLYTKIDSPSGSPLGKRKRSIPFAEEGTPPLKRKALGTRDSIKAEDINIQTIDKENQHNSPILERKRSSSVLSKLKRHSSKIAIGTPEIGRKRRRLSVRTPKRKSDSSKKTSQLSKSHTPTHLEELTKTIEEISKVSPKKLQRSSSLCEFTLSKKSSTTDSNENEKNKSKQTIKNRVLTLSQRTSQKILRPHQKLSSSLDKLEKPSVKKESYFGISLTDVMKKQKLIDNLSNVDIPYFLYHAMNMIESKYTELEGIFRISPRHTDLNELKENIDNTIDLGYTLFTSNSDSLESSNSIGHLYSGLVKRFLRELPSPLLDENLFEEWIEFASEMEKLEAPIEKVNAILSKLPYDNRVLLNRILQLACVLEKHQEINKMDSGNLSRVIGPGILWGTCSDPSASARQLILINNLTEFLIIHYNRFSFI